ALTRPLWAGRKRRPGRKSHVATSSAVTAHTNSTSPELSERNHVRDVDSTAVGRGLKSSCPPRASHPRNREVARVGHALSPSAELRAVCLSMSGRSRKTNVIENRIPSAEDRKSTRL